MNYFAYSPELDLGSFSRWSVDRRHRPVRWSALGPSVLKDFDLVFSVLDAQSGAGVASLRPSRGKRVAGALFSIDDTALPLLDAFAHVPQRDAVSGRKRTRVSGTVLRRDDQKEYDVVTYLDCFDAGHHLAPTPAYLSGLVEYGLNLGHSHGWIMLLSSVSTTAGPAEPLLYDI